MLSKRILRAKRSSLQRVDVPLPVVVADPAGEVSEGGGLQLGLVLQQLDVLALANRVGRRNDQSGSVVVKVRIPEGDLRRRRPLRRHRVDKQRRLAVGPDGADSMKKKNDFFTKALPLLLAFQPAYVKIMCGKLNPWCSLCVTPFVADIF